MADIHSKNPRTLGRGICIITGASKGFGHALAHEVSDQLAENFFFKRQANKQISRYPGVPFAEGWLYPLAGGSVSVPAAGVEARTAELH